LIEIGIYIYIQQEYTYSYRVSIRLACLFLGKVFVAGDGRSTLTTSKTSCGTSSRSALSWVRVDGWIPSGEMRWDRRDSMI
jgi:hypothetical protein